MLLMMLLDLHVFFFSQLTWVLDDYVLTKLEGTNYSTAARQESLCSHSVLRHDGKGLVIYDTLKDWRFNNNPNVINAPFVRFYASANVITPEGHNLGSICIMDSKARKKFAQSEMDVLANFAQAVLDRLDAWVLRKELEERDRRENALAEFARAALGDAPLILQTGFDLGTQLIANALEVECVILLSVTPTNSVPSADITAPDRVISSNLPGLANAKIDMTCPVTSGLVYETLGSTRGIERQFDPDDPDSSPAFVQHLGIASCIAVPAKVGNPTAANLEIGVLMAFTKDSRRVFSASDLAFLSTFSAHMSTVAYRTYADEAAVAKIAFVSSISHELRTPLHGLLGVSDLLALTPLTTTQEAFVNTIESCGRSLLGVINNVLDVAKQVSKRENQASRIKEVDLFELLQQVVDSVAATCPPNVELLLDVALPREWRYVKTDANCVRQIMVNLLGNALKFTQEGSVELTVSFVDEASAKSHLDADKTGPRLLRFSVADTGCGISESFLPNIFTRPFAQEDPLKQGTGLGLVLTRYMVTRLGGNLAVQTEAGIGTKMWMDVEMETLSPTNIKPLAPRVARVHVASPNLARCLASMLTINGMTVTYGLEGIADGDVLIVDRESPDLINLLSTPSSTKPAIQIIYLCRISQHARTVNFLELRLQRPDVAVLVITEPLGPHKLFEAFESFQNEKVPSLKPAATSLITVERGRLAQKSTPELAGGSASDGRGLGSAADRTGLAMGCVPGLAPAVEPDETPSRSVCHARSMPSLVLSPPNSAPQSVPATPADESLTLPSPFITTPPSTSSTPAGAPPPPHQLHCLIAEDNPTNRMILIQFLKKLNIAHVSAHDGQQAVNAFTSSTRRFDFVLMDIQMPVLDGLTATRRIREMEKMGSVGAQPRTRIWALTGIDTEGNKRDAFEAGVDAYLTKPVGLKELRAVLGDVYGDRVAGWTPPASTPAA
ncbi:uncharacterized protein EV422DRAFT_374042 [Fimicolochytrium jonesii]|uniref:uncharacterized protein n=1 Tax=Fimicolochytrium jonesii TaxID=1396493 RepID=UPI0022FE7A08|nr:uncharacterized protein EV422DRAFT_374042 [Fimicolochytrium jonesii]KAI8815524.1 hypothetical protein EV422DRAFT_374042 [Fimicolochytrium jonesii]